MSECRIRYDPSARRWDIADLSGGRVSAERVVLDVPAGAHPDGYLTCSGVLKTDELIGITTMSATAKSVRVVRENDLPGYLNDGPMLDWCVTRDSGSGLWVVYRQDMPGTVQVRTASVELNCHAISSDGVLHCRAEMILNGKTNKLGSEANARSVLLRTLTVYDQVIQVPVTALRALARNL